MLALCAPSSRPTSSVTALNTRASSAELRYERGHAPQGSLLLAERAQLALALVTLGEVADEAGEHRRAGRLEPPDRDLGRERAAVRAQRGQLDGMPDDIALAGAQEALYAAAVRVAQRGRHQLCGQLMAHELIGGEAEDPLGSRLTQTTMPSLSITTIASKAASSIARRRASLSRRSCCARQRSRNG